MDEVAADATVLIFLGKLRRLAWLRSRYDRILIPPVVYDAVVVQERALGEVDAGLVDEAVESGWIDVTAPDTDDPMSQFDLETGERAVLSLAIERDHKVVLVDVESIREIARLVGLEPRGTLSILFDALERGALDFDGFLDHLERLVGHGSSLDEAVYLEAVRRARALTDG